MSVTAVTAQADEAQPGTTDAARPAATDTAQPGTTDAAPSPAPEPVYYTPATQPAPVPQPAQQVVPQLDAVAQPLEREPQVIYIEGEERVVTEYVDREVTRAEESGGLHLLTNDGSDHITPDNVSAALRENYQERDQADKNKLHEVAAASALGGVSAGLVGCGLGTAAGGAGGAAAGFVAGGIPATVTAAVPVVGQVTLAGAAAAGLAGGLAGAGAGCVAVGGASAAAGAAGATQLVPNGTEAAQEYAADTVFALENGAREEDGYRGLVGNKPSGLPGYREAEESTETRDVSGTLLEAQDDEEAPATEQETAPRHAVEEAVEVPELEQPYQQVVDTVDAAQDAANDAVDQGKENFANFVDQANLPSLPI